MVHMDRSKDNSVALILSFHLYEGLGNQSQVRFRGSNSGRQDFGQVLLFAELLHWLHVAL